MPPLSPGRARSGPRWLMRPGATRTPPPTSTARPSTSAPEDNEMADAYLAISEVANDLFMAERMNAAVTQQQHLGSIDLGKYESSPYNLTAWVYDYRYLWASSPGWGEKWTYALNSHLDDPDYQPGRDEAVITDGDILATVQKLGGASEAP